MTQTGLKGVKTIGRRVDCEIDCEIQTVRFETHGDVRRALASVARRNGGFFMIFTADKTEPEGADR